ncbi:MAG TPA: hemagglutinin, partial [Myxococcaceae bacterium]|nr:hemagglutinin [Myxococcaceae bacterium]
GNATPSTASITLALGANPGGGTLSCTPTVAAVSGVATFSGLSLDKAGTGYTLTATSAALTAATSAAFNVSAAAPSQLAFTVQPSNATAGQAIAPAVRVAIQDAFGNTTNSTANVTVALGSNPGGGTLSGTPTVAAISGVATFSGLSLDKAGTGYTLTATSGALPGLASATFDISAGAANRLAFTVQPSTASVSQPITPAVQVTVQDAFGNRTGSTASITLALGANPGGGALSGATTVAAMAGVATFSNLAIDAAGTGYTLVATSTGLTGATSAAFDISGTPGLVYTDPTTAGKIRLVRNPSSTSTTVVLDLVALVPLTGYSVGMDLPLDTVKVRANSTPMIPGTALPAGIGPGPIAAKAVIPTSGPLRGMLVSGQSQKGSGTGAVTTDSAVPAGAVLYTLRLDLVAGATAGTVFDGAALAPGFRALMRTRGGVDVAAASEFSIGKLEVR